jgi:hypothetical protein
LLVVGGDQQVTAIDADYTPGTTATLRASVNIFNPYGVTPKTAWTRAVAPSTYGTAQRCMISGVQHSNGNYSFRTLGFESAITCTLDLSSWPTATVSNGVAGGAGPAADSYTFGPTFRDSATNKYYRLQSVDMSGGSSPYMYLQGLQGEGTLKTITELYAPGYSDNAPGIVVRNGYAYMAGHPSACNPTTGNTPLAVIRIRLSDMATDVFNDGYAVTDKVESNGTANGYRGRFAYVPDAGCFVLMLSGNKDCVAFKPPASWGTI